MANENTQSAALAEGIAFMEKCLDTMLSEQRKTAHNAIDMDDWSKTEEIIAKTKKNIVGIESLKAKFAEFKAEAVKLELVSGSVSGSAAPPKPEPDKAVSKPVESPEPTAVKPAEQPKPAEPPKPAADVKPMEPPKPTANANPAEPPKPAPKPMEPPKPTADATPAEPPKPAPKPMEPPKPTADVKPAEPPKPAPKPMEPPKPTAEVKPAEPPKPAPKPMEPPKPTANAKPAEPPKPAPKPMEPPKTAPKPAERPQNAPKSEANNDILDMEMSDFEPAPKPKNPIITACEELITKFPFSMRLIYSNPKIGKFFTSDNIVAENDMSKPQQLTNGLWVETDIPEERVQAFIRGILRYCEESVNM